MTEIKIQNGYWQKMLDKKYVLTWKGTTNLIIGPKLYCNAEYWRLEKLMWMVNGQEAKAKVQTSAKYIQLEMG